MVASKRYVIVLATVSMVGVVVSFAIWGYLECYLALIHQVTQGVGCTRTSRTRWAITMGRRCGGRFPSLRSPGCRSRWRSFICRGTEATYLRWASRRANRRPPVELPGVLLAGLAGIGFGIVLGPEARLLALGPGLAVLMVWLMRRDTPPRNSC